MAVLGPTFGDEVIAAGLGGLPFSWGEDGDIEGRENLTLAQNVALDAVRAAHDPTAARPDAEAVVAEGDIRQRAEAKERVTSLIEAGKTAEALKAMLDLLET